MLIDLEKFKEMGVEGKALKQILYQFTQINYGFLKFQQDIIDNRYVCHTCLLRDYIEKSFDWTSVLATVKVLRTHDLGLQTYLREIYLCTFLTRCASFTPDFVVQHGQNVMKIHGIKDQEIDVLRLFDLMMNLLLKELFKKLLDNLVQVVYDMKLKPQAIHYVMESFLFIIMEYVESWTHMFNENTFGGIVHIRKITREYSDESSCEKPIDIRYSIRKGNNG